MVTSVFICITDVFKTLIVLRLMLLTHTLMSCGLKNKKKSTNRARWDLWKKVISKTDEISESFFSSFFFSFFCEQEEPKVSDSLRQSDWVTCVSGCVHARKFLFPFNTVVVVRGLSLSITFLLFVFPLLFHFFFSLSLLMLDLSFFFFSFSSGFLVEHSAESSNS